METDKAAGDLRNIALNAPLVFKPTKAVIEERFQDVLKGRPANDGSLEPGHRYLDFAEILRDQAVKALNDEAINTGAVTNAYRAIIDRLPNE